MIVSIHQPNYLPYLGFFDKMVKSDVFVIHDDAIFTDSEYIHRNKIRTYAGWKWLTIPVFKESVGINKIKIKNHANNNTSVWNKVHFREICANYKKSSYYDVYVDELKNIYSKKYNRLMDLNIKIILFLINAFDIDVEIRLSSEFELGSRSTEKLIDIVKEVGGDIYLSGIGGRGYLDDLLFKDIKLMFQDYKCPVYNQRYSGFVSNMSAIDALLNVGGLPR